jgi:hypothetical protein
MRKIAFIIFLISFCCFNVSPQTKLTQGEYAVYASVLKAIYKENRENYSNKSEFVILNETKIDPELDLPSERKYKSLVRDFTRKNLRSGVIEKRFPRGAYPETYYLVSQAEVGELMEKGRIELERVRAKAAAESNASVKVLVPPTISFVPFFQKYPESSGLHTLSRVGFNGQYAMVQVKADRGWTGFSCTYILRRMKGRWTISTYTVNDWIT